MEQIAAHTMLRLESGELGLDEFAGGDGKVVYLSMKALAARNFESVQAVPMHILLFDWIVMTKATAQNRISSEFKIAFAFKLFHRANLRVCSVKS